MNSFMYDIMSSHMLSIVVRSFEKKNIFIYSHSVNGILTDLMILYVSGMLNHCHETKKDDIPSIKSIFVRVKK